MTHSRSDQLIERNVAFASTAAKSHVPQIPFIPNKQLYVLTCIDPRVDPAATLGLELGDAIVARTVGGRANQAFLDDLAWITYLHETKTPDADWFDLVVIHHTDCGSALMADSQLRAGFVTRGFDDDVVLRTAVVEPKETVRADVRTIVDSPAVPSHVAVSGYAYDVTTGLLDRVV